jgi:hypothetical protein
MPSSKINVIEAEALQIVSRLVEKKQSPEDAKVELKAEWPQVNKMARHLAAIANAAYGERVLFLIGVDEKAFCVRSDARPVELANWLPQVSACFEGGVVPELLCDLNIPWENTHFCVLAFDTSRAPYLVKTTRAENRESSETRKEIKDTIPDYEVPWREGRRTRTARRNDLLRLLVPASTLPDIEMITGSCEFDWRNVKEPSFGADISVRMKMFIAPLSTRPITIPFYKCRCEIVESIDGERLSDGWDLHISPFDGEDSVNLKTTSSELVALGPGMCVFQASQLLTAVPPWVRATKLDIALTIDVCGASHPVRLIATATDMSMKGAPFPRFMLTQPKGQQTTSE